jgi:hypothetical protein
MRMGFIVAALWGPLPSLENIYENSIEIVEKKFKENRSILKNSRERVRVKWEKKKSRENVNKKI